MKENAYFLIYFFTIIMTLINLNYGNKTELSGKMQDFECFHPFKKENISV